MHGYVNYLRCRDFRLVFHLGHMRSISDPPPTSPPPTYAVKHNFKHIHFNLDMTNLPQTQQTARQETQFLVTYTVHRYAHKKPSQQANYCHTRHPYFIHWFIEFVGVIQLINESQKNESFSQAHNSEDFLPLRRGVNSAVSLPV